MSIILHGICGSKGIAIGRLQIVDRSQLEVTEYVLDETLLGAEVERLYQAVEGAKLELREIRVRIPHSTSAEIASFIDTHLLMLEDSTFTQAPAALIRERRCNAEWALKLQRDELVAVFDAMDDPYLRTRKDDVDHVVTRIQRILLQQDGQHRAQLTGLLEGQIIVAHDLTAADVVLLHGQGIAGFVTEYGGPTSHTAILARSLRIPSLVGLHQVRSYVKDDDYVIIDGRSGVLIVEPDERVVSHYISLQDNILRHHAAREPLRDQPAVTRNGTPIALLANIELPGDVEAVRRVCADGVGLYRTEFLFMNRDRLPDEEEQLAAYVSVIEALDGAPVTIRTLDIGADKSCETTRRSVGLCPNPALGLRAVRLCLREPGLFVPQLRAILRASAYGPVRLMIPMVSGLQELFQVNQMLEACRRSLRRDGLPFAQELPIGAMVEVPAAALCADLFARKLDFFSIGTNDLIQYVIAIDRVDDEVNYLYDPMHPAVLRLIELTLNAAREAGIPVSMCGEMAGNSRYARLLMGMGLSEFSVPPNALLEIKQVIKDSDTSLLVPMARRLLDLPDPADQARLLDEMNAL